MEKIYYGNLEGLDGSASLSIDNLDGIGFGDDETISINLNKVPNYISSLAIFIKSFKGNNLINAEGGHVRIYESDSEKEINNFYLNEIKDGILFFYGIIEKKRENKGWFFRKMYESLEERDISYYTIFLTQSKIKKNTYPLPSENILSIGESYSINENVIFIDLGWENKPRMFYDLDISVISFDEYDNFVEIIYYNNFDSEAITLFEDNRIGNGEGDDENIIICLNLLDKNIYSLAVVINNFKGFKLNGLKSNYIRLSYLFDSIGYFSFDKDFEENGLLLGFFKKDYLFSGWTFEVMNLPLSINGIQNSVDQIKDILINSYEWSKQ